MEKTLAYSEVCQFSVNYESVMFYIIQAMEAIVRKSLSRINQIYYRKSFCKTLEHYNYLQLSKNNIINRNWKLFTKDN
jgi:hypothetical protein